jgi:methionine aminopeptidase type I
VNEVICHGIPDDRKLEEGDVVNLDITCYLNGYHGDCSEMFVAGDEDTCLDPEGRKLLQATYDCWVKAMEFVQPGNDYKDIGAIIEDHVVAQGFSTVRNFCGHGIGDVFHTNPNIYHYRQQEPNGQMAVGHTFTIEPMICEGTGTYIYITYNYCLFPKPTTKKTNSRIISSNCLLLSNHQNDLTHSLQLLLMCVFCVLDGVITAGMMIYFLFFGIIWIMCVRLGLNNPTVFFGRLT